MLCQKVLSICQKVWKLCQKVSILGQFRIFGNFRGRGEKGGIFGENGENPALAACHGERWGGRCGCVTR